ncbi:DUF4870 domain-containing protein [candidate division KSB1 bacterium]
MTGNTDSHEELPREVRQWAMFCHLSALSGLMFNGIGFLVGPLIVWLLKREEHPFIDQQGKEAVNFQITMFLAIFACVLLILLIVPILILLVIPFLMIIFPIIGAIKADRGEEYKYPITIRFIK